MFPNEDVKKYLETSSTISTESKVILELNMSLYDNIDNYGCYRYEPSKPASPYFQVADTYSSFSKVFYENNTILLKRFYRYFKICKIYKKNIFTILSFNHIFSF